MGISQKNEGSNQIETAYLDNPYGSNKGPEDTGIDLINGWVSVEIIIARTESELDGTKKELTICVDGITTVDKYELATKPSLEERSWHRIKFIGTGSIDNIVVKIPGKPLTQGYTWLLLGSLGSISVVIVAVKYDVWPFEKQGLLRTQARRMVR